MFSDIDFYPDFVLEPFIVGDPEPKRAKRSFDELRSDLVDIPLELDQEQPFIPIQAHESPEPLPNLTLHQAIVQDYLSSPFNGQCIKISLPKFAIKSYRTDKISENRLMCPPPKVELVGDWNENTRVEMYDADPPAKRQKTFSVTVKPVDSFNYALRDACSLTTIGASKTCANVLESQFLDVNCFVSSFTLDVEVLDESNETFVKLISPSVNAITKVSTSKKVAPERLFGITQVQSYLEEAFV